MKLYIVLAVLCLAQLIHARPNDSEEDREKRFLIPIPIPFDLIKGALDAATNVGGGLLQVGGQVAQQVGSGLQGVL